MTKERMQRIAAALKHEISKIIHDDLNDPRVGFVTITEVELSADLQHAKIFFTILGSEKNKKDTSIGLKQATGYIKKLIGERIKLRYIPNLTFYLDKANDYAQHIEEVIQKIRKDEDKKTE
ncbi:MAG: ribosome-binding factor A [Candidatus Omnitrophica bacterium CG07_land_8_20_14_0_80_42_15]|uniref:Ribosome-binding factor A n=1 Tax=Candidatus Aquitaenariimonas noxiae TaxID=1974741 RepID=A0A2J0KUI9_9BACT|nr:MAG: ribosome-binding factor A [Candidatus Omnitrophica bacterium CG07_land_8_20_14_0_80_42_15]